MAVLERCKHCGTPYHWEKSESALRLSFCGVLCEQAELGFSIVGLIRSELRPEPGKGHGATATETETAEGRIVQMNQVLMPVKA